MSKKLVFICFIFILLIFNEFSVAALFTSDGSLEPIQIFKIRLFNILLLCSYTLFYFSKSIFFSASIGIIFLFIIDLCCFPFLEKNNFEDTIEVFSSFNSEKKYPNLTEKDTLLGYKPRRNSTATFKRVFKATQLYNVEYIFDDQGRRVTKNKKDCTQHALFFGGSFTFGEGVRSEQTLPSYFSKQNQEHCAYNYGFRGYGPQQMLEQLKEINISTNHISEGIAIYTAIDLHPNRAIGSMRVTASTRKWFPYYDFDQKNVFSRFGSFENGRPALQSLYDILNRSNFLKLIKFDLPLAQNERTRDIFSAFLINAQKIYLRKFPKGKFIVVTYPGSQILNTMYSSKAKKELTILDMSKLFAFPSKEYTIEHDGHPRSVAHQVVAQEIAKQLSL